jgi:SSS family solute:Na+ symporter
MRANQVGVLIMIIASVIIAFLMPGSIIALATAMFMGLCASAFLPAFAVAMYSRKPDVTAAKASLITGAVVWFIWALFINTRYASVYGLCKALTGKTSLAGLPWAAVDPLVIALPLSAAVIIILQFYADRRNAEATPSSPAT